MKRRGLTVDILRRHMGAAADDDATIYVKGPNGERLNIVTGSVDADGSLRLWTDGAHDENEMVRNARDRRHRG